jgi:hypothetical protein
MNLPEPSLSVASALALAAVEQLPAPSVPGSR